MGRPDALHPKKPPPERRTLPVSNSLLDMVILRVSVVNRFPKT